MNIVIANGPCYLDNGKGVILFPSRWDSGVNGKPLFHFFPYQLALLSALLKREAEEGRLAATSIKFLDGNLEGWNGDRYIQEIAKLQPDVLICECSALTYPTMTRVMQAVFVTKEFGGDWKEKSAWQSRCTILCGPMGGYDRERALADGWTDVVVGEYELHVLELLGGIVPDEARTDAGLINLDWLPWPEDEDVDRSRYYEINHYSPRATIQIYGATRGCPLQCDFCVVPTYYGGHGKSQRSHRCRNVEDVADEIEYLAALGKQQGWQLFGLYHNEEAHSANPEWLASYCETLIRRGLNKYVFDAMCGVWTFDEELVKLCARAGYKQIRFGVESTSEKVGQAIHKSLHLEKMERFMGWCKKHGVKTYGTFMIGAPGSTEEIDLKTLADLRRWRDNDMMQKWQVSTAVPQPGTPFHKRAIENGWLITEDINLYDGFRPVLQYPNYSADAIFRVRLSAP